MNKSKTQDIVTCPICHGEGVLYGNPMSEYGRNVVKGHNVGPLKKNAAIELRQQGRSYRFISHALGYGNNPQSVYGLINGWKPKSKRVMGLEASDE